MWPFSSLLSLSQYRRCLKNYNWMPVAEFSLCDDVCDKCVHASVAQERERDNVAMRAHPTKGCPVAEVKVRTRPRGGVSLFCPPVFHGWGWRVCGLGQTKYGTDIPLEAFSEAGVARQLTDRVTALDVQRAADLWDGKMLAKEIARASSAGMDPAFMLWMKNHAQRAASARA